MKITYPSIDKLLSRVNSRYSLSVLAAKKSSRNSSRSTVSFKAL